MSDAADNMSMKDLTKFASCAIRIRLRVGGLTLNLDVAMKITDPLVEALLPSKRLAVTITFPNKHLNREKNAIETARMDLPALLRYILQ